MSMLISNENQLRRYLPNAFTSVEGEVSLYEKMLPYLREAENWLKVTVTGTEILNQFIEAEEDHTLRGEACRALTCDALMHAIPALDVVLTPNGFGIVANQNISPASKERIARLIDSMEMQRDDAVMHLLKGLKMNPSWHNSEVFSFWSQTLLPNISITAQLGIREHQFSEYLALVPRIIQIEAELANAYISPELLKHLHRYQFGIGYDTYSPAHKGGRAYVITMLRPEILSQLRGEPLNVRYMADLVNVIRSQPAIFPMWHSSKTAELFSPPVFENKKNAQGYFF